MFPEQQIIDGNKTGSPIPTFALRWLPCGEWFGIPGEESLIYPFLKISCNSANSVVLSPQDQLLDMDPETDVVRLIPETVVFKPSSLL